MMKVLRHLRHRVPILDGDLEKKHRTDLLQPIILVSVAFLCLAIFDNVLGTQTQIDTTLIDLGLIAILLFSGYFLRRGYEKWVGLIWMMVGYIGITLSIYCLGTIRVPSTAAYLVIIVTAGLMYDLRWTVVSMVICSLTVLALFYAESAGFLPMPEYPAEITQWISYTLLFFGTGYLSYRGSRSLKKALEQSHHENIERQQVEAQLRSLLRAVEQSPASIVITDLNGTIEYVNPRFCQATGYTFDEVVGQNPRILKTDLTPPGTHQQLWDTLLAGKEWRGEFVNRRKDGTTYTEIAIISTITDEQGKPSHYLGVKEDISFRRAMQDALHISEIRLQSLFEQTHDAVFILDLEGRHIDMNQRAAEMLGYSREELLSISVNETSAEVDQSTSMKNRLLSGEHIPIYERLFRRKDGTVFPAEINAELVRDGHGKPLYIQSVVREISERKRAEEALKSANESLNLQLQEIEQLQVELREQALRDPLTGLFNRRYLSETLPRELIRAQHENYPVSVIVSDVDFFKNINDTQGHRMGDMFLVEIAKIFKQSTRGSDIVCRYGGEEFLLVLPGASLSVANERAEQIRQKVQNLMIPEAGQDLRVTLSFGVAAFRDHGSSAEEIIIKADQALYYSKEIGRNRVTVWSEAVMNNSPVNS